MLYTAFTDEKELWPNNESKCRKLYEKRKKEIEYTKKHLMPFTDGVQEARELVEAVEEANRNQDIGSELDPEYEQELVECRVEEEDEHPDFIQVNPEELRVDDNLNQVKKSIRGIELKSSDDLLLEARKLDNFQKRVLHIGIKFAHDTILARKGKILPPNGPWRSRKW